MNPSPVFTPSRIESHAPFHEPRQLTEEQREAYRQSSIRSREAKNAAIRGLGPKPLHDVNIPNLDPSSLMPQLKSTCLPTLSLFSGGGGLDLGFDRAGFTHKGSWELMEDAAKTLRTAQPTWDVHGGEDGDVRGVDWRPYRTNVAVVHGGPPCQPFSNAGRQKGKDDPRNMWPEFVRAVRQVRPEVFVAENVAALAGKTFTDFVDQEILTPLRQQYHIRTVTLNACDFGVPQIRKRVFFFGFRNRHLVERWTVPNPTHQGVGRDSRLPETMGARKSLGLPDIGFDSFIPTVRSGLTGPRHTTSILSSVSAQKKFETLQIWPNGVSADRHAAQAFVARNGHFRLSVPDVAVLQGFPEFWKFSGAVYMQLGQIGNSVAPPVAYRVAESIRAAFEK